MSHSPTVRSTIARLVLEVWHSAVSWSLAVAALRAAGFLLVLPLALRRLSADELGLWYLYASIAEFCAFAELGLGLIIGRSASYFMAGVERLPAHGLLLSQASAERRAPNTDGLAGLLALGRHVYQRIVAPLVVVILTAGLFIVRYKMRALSGEQTLNLLTYGLFALATLLSISSSYWPQFLAGIGQVRLGQRALLLGLVLNYVVAAVCLLLGLGIVSLALGQLVLALVNFAYSRRQVLIILPGITSMSRVTIALTELWPGAWRSLMTSLGANMCCQGTLLVCGIVSSLSTTASYGLSLKLALVVHGFSSVWLGVRLPHIARARAAGDIAVAIDLVKGTVSRSFATYALGVTSVLFVAPSILGLMKSRTPALPTPLLAALLAVIGLDVLVGFHSAVIISANRFPHLAVYFVTGLATIALAFGLGSRFGVAGIIAAPVIAQVACVYWWIPRRCWSELNGIVTSQPSLTRRAI